MKHTKREGPGYSSKKPVFNHRVSKWVKVWVNEQQSGYVEEIWHEHESYENLMDRVNRYIGEHGVNFYKGNYTLTNHSAMTMGLVKEKKL